MHDLLSHDRIIEMNLALCTELDNSGLQGEKSVILADANILSRHNVSATLSYDNLADADSLAVVYLHSQVFGIRISTVFC